MGDAGNKTGELRTAIRCRLMSDALTLGRVRPVDMHLCDLSLLNSMNEVYGSHFNGYAEPSRETTRSTQLLAGTLVETALTLHHWPHQNVAWTMGCDQLGR